MRRKVTITVNIGAEQLEQIERASKRLRLNRSLIVRQALEQELKRLEKVPDAPKVERSQEEGSSVALPATVARS